MNYDRFGQLMQVNEINTLQGQRRRLVERRYDANGNVTHIGKEMPYSSTIPAFKDSDLLALGYIAGTNKLKTVPSQWGSDFDYDANGNVKRNGSQYFSYDPWLNKVSTIDDFEANRKLYFGYNASNERLWKRNESTIISINASDLPSVETLYLHGGNPWPLVEIETVETQAQTSGSVTQSSTTTWHIYGMNGLVATHTNDKTIEFQLKDHLGSPRVVLKQDIVNGNVTVLSAIDMYSWHPFGGILQTLGNGEPHYGFTGQEKDYESDLHNFRARQYSDNLGRFFAVDPQGQYHSPYMYGGNNPFLYTDPDGEFAHLIIGAAIGGTINWLANGADFSLKGFGHFAVGAAAGAIGAGFGAGVTSMIYKGTFSAGFIGGTNGMVISGFAAGAQVGAAAGASSGFVTGMGNSLVNGNTFGNSFGSGLGSGVAGGLSGGLFGGLGGAWTAHSRGQTLWAGRTIMPEATYDPVHVDYQGIERIKDKASVEGIRRKLNSLDSANKLDYSDKTLNEFISNNGLDNRITTGLHRTFPEKINKIKNWELKGELFRNKKITKTLPFAPAFYDPNSLTAYYAPYSFKNSNFLFEVVSHENGHGYLTLLGFKDLNGQHQVMEYFLNIYMQNGKSSTIPENLNPMRQALRNYFYGVH